MANSEDLDQKISLIWVNLIKLDPNYYTALFGSDNIQLRVMSDWPSNEPMESLLPTFGPVAYGAKCKMMFVFDITDAVADPEGFGGFKRTPSRD